MKALTIQQAKELITMGLDYKTADALLSRTQVFDIGEPIKDKEDYERIEAGFLQPTWTLEGLLKVLPPTYDGYKLTLSYLDDGTPAIAYKSDNEDLVIFTGESFLNATYECIKWFLVQDLL